MRSENGMHGGTNLAIRFRVRLRRDWRRALVLALTEPANDPESDERDMSLTPIEELAARVVDDVWPHVEDAVRPIFEMLPAHDVQAQSRSGRAAPKSPATVSVGGGVWRSAEEVAPVLGMTAHTLRRLARKGESPVVVRRIGGRWCFSRVDLERLVDGTR